MRHRKIADVPLAAVPVSLRLAEAGAALDRVTRIVILAMGTAFIFLAVRIIGQI